MGFERESLFLHLHKKVLVIPGKAEMGGRAPSSGGQLQHRYAAQSVTAGTIGVYLAKI